MQFLAHVNNWQVDMSVGLVEDKKHFTFYLQLGHWQLANYPATDNLACRYHVYAVHTYKQQKLLARKNLYPHIIATKTCSTNLAQVRLHCQITEQRFDTDIEL